MITLYDTFDGTDGTDIDSHAPNSISTGSAWVSLAANTIELDGSGALKFLNSSCEAIINIGNPEQRLASNFTAGGAHNTLSYYLRRSSGVYSGASAYEFHIRPGIVNSDRGFLNRYVAGVYTTLATINKSLQVTSGSTDLYEFVANSNNLRFTVNGSTWANVTDTVITTGDYFGIRHWTRNSSGSRMFDVVVKDSNLFTTTVTDGMVIHDPSTKTQDSRILDLIANIDLMMKAHDNRIQDKLHLVDAQINLLLKTIIETMHVQSNVVKNTNAVQKDSILFTDFYSKVLDIRVKSDLLISELRSSIRDARIIDLTQMDDYKISLRESLIKDDLSNTEFVRIFRELVNYDRVQLTDTYYRDQNVRLVDALDLMNLNDYAILERIHTEQNKLLLDDFALLIHIKSTIDYLNLTDASIFQKSQVITDYLLFKETSAKVFELMQSDKLLTDSQKSYFLSLIQSEQIAIDDNIYRYLERRIIDFVALFETISGLPSGQLIESVITDYLNLTDNQLKIEDKILISKMFLTDLRSSLSDQILSDKIILTENIRRDLIANIIDNMAINENFLKVLEKVSDDKLSLYSDYVRTVIPYIYEYIVYAKIRSIMYLGEVINTNDNYLGVKTFVHTRN